MAGTRVVEGDLQATLRQMAALRPEMPQLLGITEHNSLFTLGGASTDKYLASLTGALYVADLIRLYASTPSVFVANYWSLTGNWFFGALDQTAKPRPAYEVLKTYRNLLAGRMVPAEISAPALSNARVGFVPGMTGTPALAALATWDGTVLRATLLNRHFTDHAALQLALPRRFTVRDWRFLSAPGPFDAAATWSDARASVALLADGPKLEVPPHSFGYLELEAA
jgi:hypothetical protein